MCPRRSCRRCAPLTTVVHGSPPSVPAPSSSPPPRGAPAGAPPGGGPAVRVEPNVLYTDDGQFLTSAGSAAGLDLCLHIVCNDHGTRIANALARRLVIPPHREGRQAQY